MVILILWFDTAKVKAEKIEASTKTYFARSRFSGAQLEGLRKRKTHEGNFVLVTKEWRRNFYLPHVAREISCIPQAIMPYLSRVQLVSTVKFPNGSGQYRTRIVRSGKDQTVIEELPTDEGVELSVDIHQNSMPTEITDFMLFTLDFLANAAIRHLTAQALGLLNEGGRGTTAGVRRKLEEIEELTQMCHNPQARRD